MSCCVTTANPTLPALVSAELEAEPSTNLSIVYIRHGLVWELRSRLADFEENLQAVMVRLTILCCRRKSKLSFWTAYSMAIMAKHKELTHQQMVQRSGKHRTKDIYDLSVMLSLYICIGLKWTELMPFYGCFDNVPFPLLTATTSCFTEK